MAEAIGDLLNTVSFVQPGVSETQEAIDAINSAIGELDSALISIAVGSFEKLETDYTHQELQDQMVGHLRMIGVATKEVLTASRYFKYFVTVVTNF